VPAGFVAADAGEFTAGVGAGSLTVDAPSEVVFEISAALSRVVPGALEPRAAADDADADTHGLAGSTGTVHAGRIRTKAGIARCPMTAAVQTAWREAADLLLRK
jgi:hypothetical protein